MATRAPSASPTRRVLVVIDDACTAPELCAGLGTFAGEGRIEVLVLAPAHGTAASQWYADDDAAHADAMSRLRTCINCLTRFGITVSGQLCDADPVQGIVDALRIFPADEILLVTATPRPSRWLGPNVIDRARQALPQVITHVVMPPVSQRSDA